MMSRVEQLARDYNRHPYLKEPGNSAKSRLKALYDILDVLAEVCQEVSSKLLWQAEEGHYELKDKWRNKLRDLLIAD
ncbi:hypothetical protein B0919_15875 [Hymenobacter sp. CRA2]|nr:hypothetical protein B0919_15875 [Hymenobacter sp. CRA2]